MKFEGKEYEVQRNPDGSIVSIHEVNGHLPLMYSAVAMFIVASASILAVQFTDIENRFSAQNRKRLALGFFGAVPLIGIVLLIVAMTQRSKPVDAATFARLSADPNFK